jgi:hypothetical protein
MCRLHPEVTRAFLQAKTVYIIYGHVRPQQEGMGGTLRTAQCAGAVRPWPDYVKPVAVNASKVKVKAADKSIRPTSQLFLLRAFHLRICHRLALGDAEIFDIL